MGPAGKRTRRTRRARSPSSERTARDEPEVRCRRRAGRRVEGQAGAGAAVGNGGDAVSVGGRLLCRRRLLHGRAHGEGAADLAAWPGICFLRRHRPRRPPGTEADHCQEAWGLGLVRQSVSRTAGTERPARDDVAPEQLGPEEGQQLHLRGGRRAPLRGQRRRRHVWEHGQRADAIQERAQGL